MPTALRFALTLALLGSVAACDGVGLVGSGGSQSKPDVGVVFSLDLLRWRRPPAPVPEPPETGTPPKPRVPEDEKKP